MFRLRRHNPVSLRSMKSFLKEYSIDLNLSREDGRYRPNKSDTRSCLFSFISVHNYAGAGGVVNLVTNPLKRWSWYLIRLFIFKERRQDIA